MASTTVCCSLVVLVLAISQIVDGELVTQSCPNTSGQESFDVSQYLGKWYEYQRFSAWFEMGVVCGSAEYGRNDDGSLSVVNGGHRNIFGFKVPTSVTGKATTPNEDKPSELTVSFSRFQPAYGPANYFVLETDYTNYSVVFSCSDLTAGLSIQYAWILTRERGQSPANLPAIYDNLQSAGVDRSYFKMVDQSNCDSS